MPTVIDSLSIEIESNSTNASQGIEALAKSLGELKKNGAVGVAVKNLNNLSSALKNMTSTASNANKISSLAKAMSELKAVGSTGTGVKKLAESLSAMKSVDYSAIQKAADSSELFRDLAASTGALSAVKAGGFGAMVNSLAKIGEVTKKLDDDTIARFAERVELVSQKIGPLSEKMATMKAGFNAINSSARKASGGVAHLGTRLNKTAINTSALIHIFESAARWAQKAVNKVSEFIGDAIEWEGISARFGRGFGPQAQETYEWIQKLNQEMGINIQQFMQYSSTYATMLKGFGVAQADASKMALGYMELTYDIWAGYNDQYKSLEDAAEAVRSAIAGEVEPVRKAGFTIIESTLEQTAANHGLKISLENATEAQKSYLRYLTMMDQAHSQGIVGTYAKELNTAEGVMRTLSQQVKSLAQSFGSLFLPILVRIVPYLQAVVDLAKEAIYQLAALLGVEIQAVDFSGYNSRVNAAVEGTDALAKSAKEAKKQLMGIDELTVLQDNSGSEKSGGAGLESTPIESLWDEAIFDNIQSQVAELKEKVAPILDMVVKIGGALLALKIADSFFVSLDKAKEALGKIKGDADGLTKAEAITIGVTIAIAGATIEWGAIKDAISNGLNWSNLAEMIVGEGGVTAGGALIGKAFGDAIKGASIGGILASAPAFGTAIYDAVQNGLDSENATSMALNGVALGTSIGALFGPGGAIAGAILGGASGLMSILAFQFAEDWDEIKLGFVTSAQMIPEEWNNLLEAIKFEEFKNRIGDFFKWCKDEGKRSWDSVKDDWKDLKAWWSKLELPAFKIKKPHLSWSSKEAEGWIAKTLSALGLPTSLPKLNVSWYANGGFPATGEMFIARENGIPEMVGRMGSRTAVANNDQIVEGVASGVASANEELIAAFYAMGQQIVDAINSKDTATYIDTKRITTAQAQRSRAYGV